MRVGIATDHGGFGLKEESVAQLSAAGHEVVGFEPDQVTAVAKELLGGK